MGLHPAISVRGRARVEPFSRGTSCLPWWSQAWLGAVVCCHCPASQEYLSTCRGPGEKSEFKIWSTVSTESVSLSWHCKVGKSLSGTALSRGLRVRACHCVRSGFRVRVNRSYGMLGLWNKQTLRFGLVFRFPFCGCCDKIHIKFTVLTIFAYSQWY